MKKPGNGRTGTPQLGRDLGLSPVEQVMKCKHFPFGFRQHGQGLGQLLQFFMLDGLLAR
jgi:hypothetical protein